jgi:hypothetical protein
LTKDVTYYHPNIDAEYTNGVGIDSSKHPDIHELLEGVLPPTHPNVQDMLENPAENPLPGDWYGTLLSRHACFRLCTNHDLLTIHSVTPHCRHPVISQFQKRAPAPSIHRDVSYVHPLVDQKYAAGTVLV